MNKKGITLVEIIISIVLISIVLIFLFSLLITVKDINDESEVNSTYLINKSLILKNIENDLSKASSVTLSECNDPTSSSYPIRELYEKYAVDHTGGHYFSIKNGPVQHNLKAFKCLKFTYSWINDDNVSDSGEKEGLLGIYYYKSKDSYVISYIRGDVKATRLLPDFENTPSIEFDSANNKYVLKEWIQKTNVDSTTGYLKGFNLITIPIIGNDGKDYGINISYYK